MSSREDNAKTISPELMARIEALEDEGLKVEVLRVLSGPGRRTITNEQIFENRVASWNMAKLQRATLYLWHDDEVMAFVEYFMREMPNDYAEYLRQERECNQIDSELSWKVRRLAMRWMSDLDFSDYTLLSAKVRGHARSAVHAND
jgi:hypothetical protein